MYGASGRALFDIQVIPGAPVMLEIYPYFKDGSSVTQNYQSAPGTTVGGVQSGAEKFTFVEFIKDYFENVKLIEMQNFLGALVIYLNFMMMIVFLNLMLRRKGR